MTRATTVHLRDPLTRKEVVSVIEGRSTARRVPVQIHLWVHPETFGERKPAIHDLLARYPADVRITSLRIPDIHHAPTDDPGYRWLPYDDPYEGQNVPYDRRIAMADWSRLDEILARFPNPNYPGLLNGLELDAGSFGGERPGRYRLGHWWYCFFERHWSLRGMTNALTDYYDHPQEVHRLFRALTDFYLRIMERARLELGVDGIFTSDDLGTQTQPFFSKKIFREFFKPYYKEMIDCAHRLGMHFWLHACGNIEPFIPDWIEIGLDVLHPIQKYTMDERAIARQYGNQLTILAGLDVQQVIPWGTPAQVRAEVRHLIDTYWRKGEGRLILTAGNGINEDCPTESLEAFFDEAVEYGARIVNPPAGFVQTL